VGAGCMYFKNFYAHRQVLTTSTRVIPNTGLRPSSSTNAATVQRRRNQIFTRRTTQSLDPIHTHRLLEQATVITTGVRQRGRRRLPRGTTLTLLAARPELIRLSLKLLVLLPPGRPPPSPIHLDRARTCHWTEAEILPGTWKTHAGGAVPPRFQTTGRRGAIGIVLSLHRHLSPPPQSLAAGQEPQAPLLEGWQIHHAASLHRLPNRTLLPSQIPIQPQPMLRLLDSTPHLPLLPQLYRVLLRARLQSLGHVHPPRPCLSLVKIPNLCSVPLGLLIS
jgi:hypothetical protein